MAYRSGFVPSTPPREAEDVHIFTGESSSLSVPLEIKPSFWQRVKSVDWLDWLSAIGALLAMYAVFGSYFYLLLYASEAIRGENFRVLPQKFYGSFQVPPEGSTQPPVPFGFETYPVGFSVPWNATIFK